MTQPPREAWVGVMAKHLPPSGATLRLLDVGGDAGETLLRMRPDLEIQPVAATFAKPDTTPDSSDAVAVYAQALTPSLLQAALDSLRPGGRLIVVLPHEQPAAAWVSLLEQHGYTRILVEPALTNVLTGVLIRGEKPHTTDDTLARIRVASAHDDTLTDLSRYPGRFIYLLVRQTPNKPIWALREGEQYAWDAVTVTINHEAIFLAFSSLAKAVAFMQPAVLAGHIRDINKVAKYRIENVRGWGERVMLNPPEGYLASNPFHLQSIDLTQAEAPDE
jgi:hypothetical protein